MGEMREPVDPLDSAPAPHHRFTIDLPVTTPAPDVRAYILAKLAEGGMPEDVREGMVDGMVEFVMRSAPTDA